MPQPAIPPATTNELFQQAPLIIRNQDEFSEEYAQPQQSPPVVTLPPQTAPHFIPSDAIVITSTNAPETTTVAVVSCSKMDQYSGGKKLPIFVDIRKVYEKWSIFCFYGIF